MINSQRRPGGKIAMVAATGDAETLAVEVVGAIMAAHEQLAPDDARKLTRLIRAVANDLERGASNDSSRDSTDYGYSAGGVPPILRPQNGGRR